MTEDDSGPTGAAATSTRALVEELLNDGGGVLRLAPAFVARDLVPPGRRLGLAEEAYDLGERGFVCERWLGSTTRADNRIGPPDEGLGHVVDRNGRPRLTLRDAVRADPAAIMGSAYAASHPQGLGRLAKLLDYGARIPYHIHPPQRFAELVGRRSKDEAYYFPAGVDGGAHPETFFGVHPWILRERAYDVLLPYLVDWDSDLILRHSRAYLQVPDDGFGVPSGVLHGPGTALTVELQEDSDVFAMFQARNAGRIISKELLFKDVRPADRHEHGERFPLRFVEWDLNGDPYFYENNHLAPRPVAPDGGREWWIFYNTPKFSGKKLVVPAGQRHASRPSAACTRSSSGRAADATAATRYAAATPTGTSCSSRTTSPRPRTWWRTPAETTWWSSSSSART
ncbi:cupin domain-containing protein [Plantactinospora endophytica]|uniref:Dioxygenase n=1 Tax=Plantactinospora endophytica TaxID=673535 RepID=A0ABQ4E269_9ACTN|nr:hypothetical protein [Plantactinospora endophytica]GIG88411.1 hypothetical protein Pen02_33470 [Plantactinospora endophytica]